MAKTYALFHLSRSREWAARHWDTFGFDYDPETSNPVTVWPLEHLTDEELANSLRGSDIHFTVSTLSEAEFSRVFG